MKLSDRINRVLHQLMRCYVVHGYARKLHSVMKLHPSLFEKRDEVHEQAFRSYWKELLPSVNPHWATLYANLSGMEDVRFVPEDVFYGVIERCLNNCNTSGVNVEDKCDVNFYIPEQYRPKMILAYVRGVFFDSKMEAISPEEAALQIQQYRGDVICKPSMGTCGGAGVLLFKNNGNNEKVNKGVLLKPDWLAEHFEGAVIQEVVRQEKVVKSFNPGSLNTCRLITFRRPWNGHVDVVAGMLRMGNGDSVIDNVTRGGVCVDVDAQGKLADFGLDYRFAQVHEHPTTHRQFQGVSLPYYDDMCRVVCSVAKRIPSFNLLGFDVVARENGEICIIEINATSISLKPQTRRPLFGDETDRVKQWCLDHAQFDTFRHFRSWYD